eukprot:Filipodium_phascolosomae@DN2313_c0_g1_i3.p1
MIKLYGVNYPLYRVLSAHFDNNARRSISSAVLIQLPYKGLSVYDKSICSEDNICSSTLDGNINQTSAVLKRPGEGNRKSVTASGENQSDILTPAGQLDVLASTLSGLLESS